MSAPEKSTKKRLESVWFGRDHQLLDALFDFHAPDAQKIIDVCCNQQRMWKGSKTADKVTYYDRDPEMHPDVVTTWDTLPDLESSVDVLVYDPPHLPDAAASKKALSHDSLTHYKKSYGLGNGIHADNIGSIRIFRRVHPL